MEDSVIINIDEKLQIEDKMDKMQSTPKSKENLSIDNLNRQDEIINDSPKTPTPPKLSISTNLMDNEINDSANEGWYKEKSNIAEVENMQLKQIITDMKLHLKSYKDENKKLSNKIKEMNDYIEAIKQEQENIMKTRDINWKSIADSIPNINFEKLTKKEAMAFIHAFKEKETQFVENRQNLTNEEVSSYLHEQRILFLNFSKFWISNGSQCFRRDTVPQPQILEQLLYGLDSLEKHANTEINNLETEIEKRKQQKYAYSDMKKSLSSLKYVFDFQMHQLKTHILTELSKEQQNLTDIKIKDIENQLQKNQQELRNGFDALLQEIKELNTNSIQRQSSNKSDNDQKVDTGIHEEKYIKLLLIPDVSLQKVNRRDILTELTEISQEIKIFPKIIDSQITKNKNIILTLDSIEDEELIIQLISESQKLHGNITVINLTMKTQQILLLNIPSRLNKETIQMELDKRLPELRFKLEKSIKTKNDKFVHWMAETTRNIARKFFKNYTSITLFFQRKIIVTPYISLNRCTQCQRFNHIKKYCKNPIRCADCGNEHHSNDCTYENDEKRCINCYRQGFEHRGHAAYSRRCPVYIEEKTNLMNKFFSKNDDIKSTNQNQMKENENIRKETEKKKAYYAEQSGRGNKQIRRDQKETINNPQTYSQALQHDPKQQRFTAINSRRKREVQEKDFERQKPIKENNPPRSRQFSHENSKLTTENQEKFPKYPLRSERNLLTSSPITGDENDFRKSSYNYGRYDSDDSMITRRRIKDTENDYIFRKETDERHIYNRNLCTRV